MDANSGGPSESQGQPSPHVESTPRLKKDIAWKYTTEISKTSYLCNFCQKTFNGGGITRMKQHLAGARGHVQACLKVPGEVRFQMKCSLQENAKRAHEKHNVVGGPSETEVVELDGHDGNPETANLILGKRKAPASNLQSYFKLGMNDPSQPSIKACMQSKERWHDTDLAVCMWLYDACIPLNAINSPFFPIAMSKVASMGHGYYGPSYHAARVTLLKDAKESVKLIVDNQRQYWAENGCTIMADGWKDSRKRPLINFMVYCVKGISFIKSVDASDIETTAENLCNLFAEIVDIVGPENVVHMVTDNAANYKAAGALLCERYHTISWSPCAAHCINLIMKDISEMDHVADIVTLATRVTSFLYNHKYTLNWLRQRPGWTEIVRPGETRFGTTFIALKSLHDHKADLQAFVTSHDYIKNALKLPKARDVKLTVLDEKFWNNSLIIVKVMGPLLRLLRICDSDNNPALGYVYEGMYRARKGIKELFCNNKRLYKPYTTIIRKRWDRMFRKNLHAAAYWLNPAFQYDQENFCSKTEVFNGVLDLIEDKVIVDGERIFLDLSKFKERLGSFNRPIAHATRKKTCPHDWWRAFGGDFPALQKFAIRILSQTASSSGCERNWSVFERIHTKRRNRLEHERLNDLVYVHYNLRLQNRGKQKGIYDPIDFESIDKTEDWIVEDAPEKELDYDEIENMLDEHPPINNENTTGNENNEDDMVGEEVDLTLYERSIGLSINHIAC